MRNAFAMYLLRLFTVLVEIQFIDERWLHINRLSVIGEREQNFWFRLTTLTVGLTLIGDDILTLYSL
jgi:hypothetical protein